MYDSTNCVLILVDGDPDAVAKYRISTIVLFKTYRSQSVLSYGKLRRYFLCMIVLIVY